MLVGVRVARVLEVIVGRETDADFFSTDGCSDGFDDLEGESTAVCDGAAVLICAGVDVVVEELVEEVSVCAWPVVSLRLLPPQILHMKDEGAKGAYRESQPRQNPPQQPSSPHSRIPRQSP